MDSNYIVRRFLGTTRRFLLFVVLISLFLAVGVGAIYFGFGRVEEQTLLPSSAILPATGDDASLGGGLSQKLTVNAQLQVNGQFYLAPSTLPENAAAGTIVFDQLTSTLQYFNGREFVSLSSQGNITIPEAGVTSLQGQTGAISLVPGAGVTINGTTISASGLLGVNGVPGDINVATANGVASLSLPQSIAPSSSPTFANLAINGNIVLSSAGIVSTNRVQQVAAGQDVTIDAGADDIVFTVGGRSFQLPTSGPASQTICTTGISCVSGGGQAVLLAPGTAQTDNTPDASIFINDTGGGNLIQLQAGGVNRFVVAANGDTTIGGTLNINTLRRTVGPNTTTLGFTNPSANTTINMPALPAGTYEVCTTASNCIGATAVDSLNGLTGALTLANASGLGSTITINDASTAQKGIAQFNATNFSVSSGVVNTIQSIASTASPTFNGLTLSTALSVANGGTGRNTLSSNAVLVGNGTGQVQQVASGGAGQCLVSTAGAPIFTSCPGSGGVASIDGQTGAVTMNNASGAGGVITIDDASTAQKGIAQFNATNFSVSSGVVNTIQGIAASSSPTFAGLTLSSALTVGNGGTGSSSASGARTNLGAAASGANGDITSTSVLNTITPSAALTVGTSGFGITVQGSNASTFRATSGSFTTILGFATPSANATINLPALNAGTYEICTTSGNCLGGGNGGANTSLSNLASVAINTALLPGSTAIDLGSAAAPFRDLYIGGTATNNFRFTGTATAGRTITVPDATGTICLSTGNCLGGGGGAAPSSAQYLTLATDSSLSAERVLTAGTNISFTDGGANGALTVSTVANPTFNRITVSEISMNDRTINELIGDGLAIQSGALTVLLGSSVNLATEVDGTLPIANGGTNGTAAPTQGGVAYGTGSAYAFTAAGTSGQCLISNGTSAPTFQTCTGDGAGITSIGAIDSQTVSLNGAVISGASLYLQSASTTMPGLVNISAQTFAGNKTFDGVLRVGTGGVSTIVSGAGDMFVQNNLELNGDLKAVEGVTYLDVLEVYTSAMIGDVNTDTLTINAGSSGSGITFTDSSFANCTLTTVANVLTCGPGGSGGDILQNGNSFGGTMRIGTNDAHSLVLETNNQSALTIASGGAITLQNATNSTSALRVNNASGDRIMQIDTSNNRTGFNLPSWMSLDYSFQAEGYADNSSGSGMLFGNYLSGSTSTGQTGARYVTSVGSPASASYREYSSNTFQINTGTTANTVNSKYFALQTASYIDGSSSVNELVGGFIDMGITAGASAGAIKGFDIVLNNSGSGTAGTVTGINIRNMTGGGAVTNQYGINIANQTAGTNNYGLYIQGASTYALWVDSGVSRFDGNVVLDAALPVGDNNTQVCRASTGVLSTCVGGSSGSLFTDAGGHTYLTSTSDQLVVGSTSSMSAKLAVVGTANQTQFLIRAHSGQTAGNPLVVFQASGGSEMARLHVDTDNNLTFGQTAQASRTSGGNNIGLGRQALQYADTGEHNIAVGESTLQNATGSNNVAIGQGVLRDNSGGGNSVGIGYNALANNETGSANIAIGNSAMQNSEGGENNIALGVYSLQGNTGSWNLGLGHGALQYNTGNQNIGFGTSALSSNTGDNSIALGNQALQDNETGENNIAIGRSAMIFSEGGWGNLAFGMDTLQSNNGDNNIALGVDVLRDNSTGNDNIGIGYQALRENGIGIENIAIGRQALYAAGTGNQNVALGVNALNLTDSGSYNTALGHAAGNGNGNWNNSATANVFLGAFSGNDINSGANNTFLGTGSGYGNTNGSNNIAIGYQSGDNVTTGNYNITLGVGIDAASATADYQLNIANILRSSNYQTGNLVVGTSDTTGQLLVLDTKTDAGDPTGVNGGMYYNSNSGAFRMHQAGNWWTVGNLLHGGNSIGSTLEIGTNDANSVALKANGTNRLTITSAGDATLQANTVINGLATGTGAALGVFTNNTTRAGLSIQGHANQVYNLIEATNAGLGYSMFEVQQDGEVHIRPSIDGTGVLNIRNASGSSTVLRVSTTDNTVYTSFVTSVGGFSTDTALTFTGNNTTNYTTPLGTSLATRINIQNYNPGAFNQLVAMGLPSSAHANSRAITLLDARTGNHQPTLAVISPNESQIFGLSWDGINTYGALKSSVGLSLLVGGNTNQALAIDSNGSAQFTSNNDATYLFEIAYSGGTESIFTADTANQRIKIGNAADNVGVLLQLDDKSNAGDPTGVAGGMYYNSNAGKFRCYQAGAWIDCIGGGPSLRSLKKDVDSLDMGLNTLRQLQPVAYSWKDSGRADIGFIAEDVEAIDRRLAEYNGFGQLTGVNYLHMSALLTSAVKELDLKVQSIEARLVAVESGNFAGNITIGGKIITAGHASTAVLGAQAASTSSVMVSGNDITGTLTYSTTNAASISGEQARVVFSSAYTARPRVTLTPASSAAAAIRYYIERTQTEFKIIFLDPPVQNQTYIFDYQVMQ